MNLKGHLGKTPRKHHGCCFTGLHGKQEACPGGGGGGGGGQQRSPSGEREGGRGPRAPASTPPPPRTAGRASVAAGARLPPAGPGREEPGLAGGG